ncbi:serine hydrolase domain-containing protein [Nocardia spumae]|uniref:serine hydrolase domain-containing protein n=1 Tax=Nocardia spumae TaxID=2887190 RepID=UPI001D136C1A|nr:serine hydrolase domain-containing protein [Nocardia spumae]
MSNDAFSAGSAALPAGVTGYAAVEFEPLVRNFARIVGGRIGAGGGLTVHRYGERVVEVRTGYSAGTTPWTQDTASVAFSATKGIASTVVHRLADRGLIDYAAPVAEYWPAFGAAGKSRITVAQLMTHRAGLSSLPGIAAGLDEVLDHELMEDRLAAAKPDRLLGVPAYHALTYGWLLAGLTRAITGSSMRELFRTEVSEPLGIDGLHLGRPGPDSATTVAALAGSKLALAGTALGGLVLGRAGRFPGPPGAATRALFLPGLQALFDGDEPSILNTEMPAGNGVFTANALASVYGVLADGGMVSGRRYLSAHTMRAVRRVQTHQLDHALFYLPMMWHLGYHTFPIPGTTSGFGHIGLGGSFGWADPRLGLSVGFVHNRFTPQSFVWDQMAAAWVLPLAVRGARAMSNGRRSLPRERAA